MVAARPPLALLSVNARIGVNRARGARADARLGLDGPVEDLLELVEERFRVPVAVLALDDGVAGAWISGTVFVNARHAVVRRRFTLAHELGHVRMGHAPVVDHPDAFTAFEAGAPDEVQANTFAAEFLAPRQALLARVEPPVTLEDVVHLACEFGVSARMMRIRLGTIRVVDAGLGAKLDAEIEEGLHKAVAERLRCPTLEDSLAQVVPPRLPQRPSALAAHLAGELSLPDLARQLRETPERIESMLAGFGLG